MSNYTKSFNFQNGVQVDDDNFVVTQGGLVGIGTSVPSKTLDVRGNADISGILTTSGMNVGAAVSVGANIIIDAASGIITATKFIGSAGNLSGIVAIATDGFVAQAGSLSTTAKVGIKTDNPVFELQVGSDPRTSTGVGITNGNVLISGVTTTANMVVSGLATTKDLFVSGVSTFSNDINAPLVNLSSGVGVGNSIYHVDDTDTKIAFENDQISLNVAGSEKLKLTQGGFNFTGVSTFGGDVDINANFEVTGILTSTNIYFNNNALISNFDSNGISGSNIDHIWHSDINNYYGTGGVWNFVSDSTYKAVGNSAIQIGYLASSGGGHLLSDVGIGTTVPNDPVTSSNTAKLAVGIVTTNSSFTRDLKVTGISTFNDNILVSTGATVGLGTSAFFPDDVTAYFGADDDLQIFHQSSDNTSRILSNEKDLIIYTTNPNSVKIKTNDEDAIVATANDGVELYHDSVLKFASVSVGATVYGQLDVASLNGGSSSLSTYFGSLKYGNESAGFPYSSRRSLDLINNDSGNVNFYLDANNVGVDTGDFHWFKGANSAKLMTLTYQGALGIGVTDPEFSLHVSGSSTITGNLSVQGNQNVFGAANVTDDLTVGGNLNVSTVNSNVTGNVTGDLAGNVFTETGISTFKKVGIDTTIITESVSLDCISGDAAFRRIGIGSTQPDCILDVSDGVGVNTTKKFILLPLVSAGQTAELTSESTVGGGFIYNTSLRKLQFYNGTEWETVTSVVL